MEKGDTLLNFILTNSCAICPSGSTGCEKDCSQREAIIILYVVLNRGGFDCKFAEYLETKAREAEINERLQKAVEIFFFNLD
ncbi:hypothetical protein PUN28_019872 [Cardiocondyla obscurior]|uniref:Uncharacterized protein n=1 Tax=Cardiocondyla obscurior TaxID=286306 RepID=A0AAW2EAP0_9HYME